MKYPKLVRKQDCKTPVQITFYSNELGEDGEQISYGPYAVSCNYQEKLYNENTDKSAISRGLGKIYLTDDIIPGHDDFNDGFVEILGNKRQIKQVIKARNPDGTVNYLEIDVI
jgi:hypothetical protein